MRGFLGACLCACIVTCPNASVVLTSNSVERQFDEWAQLHQYRFDADEYAERLSIFTRNTELIQQHKDQSYAIGPTKYAHLTAAELGARGRNIACSEQHPPQAELIQNRRINDGDLPAEVDWRVKNVFTPVKSETRHCISSYALATTATVEAYLALDRGELIELSYEQILDCSTGYGNRQCDGGSHMAAYAYLKDVNGLQSATTYPPGINKTEQCHFVSSYVLANVANVLRVGAGKRPRAAEADITNMLAMNGPVTVGINLPADFHLYTSGIYNTKDCSKDPADINYSLVIVGYNDTDVANSYWIARAAFGQDFGLDGHVHIAKGHNLCGLATCAAYPKVKMAQPPS